MEKAFADRQSRHDDAIKSLRRSHDAKFVALKASHAKELTMVKTAIHWRRTKSALLRSTTLSERRRRYIRNG